MCLCSLSSVQVSMVQTQVRLARPWCCPLVSLCHPDCPHCNFPTISFGCLTVFGLFFVTLPGVFLPIYSPLKVYFGNIFPNMNQQGEDRGSHVRYRLWCPPPTPPTPPRQIWDILNKIDFDFHLRDVAFEMKKSKLSHWCKVSQGIMMVFYFHGDKNASPGSGTEKNIVMWSFFGC